jgi:hypothetical protein
VFERIDTTNDIASEAIKRYREQMLEHAKAAVRRVTLREREITSTSMVMSPRAGTRIENRDGYFYGSN